MTSEATESLNNRSADSVSAQQQQQPQPAEASVAANAQQGIPCDTLRAMRSESWANREKHSRIAAKGTVNGL